MLAFVHGMRIESTSHGWSRWSWLIDLWWAIGLKYRNVIDSRLELALGWFVCFVGHMHRHGYRE